MKLKINDANRLFHQGTLALARIERNGIYVNTDLLKLTTEKVEQRIQKLTVKLRDSKEYKQWRRMAGGDANLGSREQLGRLLFDYMKIPYEGELTKTNRYKVDDTILSALHHPFVDRLLRVEKLKKLKGTYLDGISKEVVDNFLHVFYHLNTAASGRGSCSDINFQNIPIRDPDIGEAIRSVFEARADDRVLAEIDFGAHEWNIAACFWQDPRMVEYASDPTKDIHRDMAAECYAVPKDKVSKDTRYCGKNGFVFPRLYGSYYCQIARNMWGMIDEKRLTVGDVGMRAYLKTKGIRELGACDPKRDARPGTFERHIKDVEKRFDSRFSGLTRAKEEWVTLYRKRGWFQMPTGFRCQGVYSNNQLFNYPIQGSAFHCLLLSLILMQKELRKRKMKSLIVGQIHDCVLLDCPMRELQDVLAIITNIMTNEIRRLWSWVIVPLKAEVDVAPAGGNWHQKAPWHEINGIWKPKAA